MIGHIYYFFWDQVPDVMIDVARWVGDFTGSDTAEIGAVLILFPVSVAITSLGMILTTVVLGPLVVLYTLAALSWALLREAGTRIRNSKGEAA
ncbi:hypothetical protein ACODUO_14990 [Stenotrophomonas maltophilia]